MHGVDVIRQGGHSRRTTTTFGTTARADTFEAQDRMPTTAKVTDVFPTKKRGRAAAAKGKAKAKAAETVGASAHLTISKFRRIGHLRDP